MVSLLRRAGKFLWLAFHWLPAVWDWLAVLAAVAVLVGVPTTVGSVVGAGASPVAGLSWAIAVLLGILCLMLTIAGIRLQGSIEQLKEPKKIPGNRDAIIMAINELANKALNLISSHIAWDVSSVGYSGLGQMQRDQYLAEREALNAARAECVTVADIAGIEFRKGILFTTQLIDMSTELILTSQEAISNEKGAEAIQSIDRIKRGLIERMDAGMLASDAT